MLLNNLLLLHSAHPAIRQKPELGNKPLKASRRTLSAAKAMVGHSPVLGTGIGSQVGGADTLDLLRASQEIVMAKVI